MVHHLFFLGNSLVRLNQIFKSYMFNRRSESNGPYLVPIWIKFIKIISVLVFPHQSLEDGM